ncbi:hypothetical protein [Mesonia sp. K4-1]|uniref:hypothetical protein n=1 Tax=Mesonia sp. K4-1 TaxID=2602760 RepID=UPI0011CCA73F|nr:hypothetical protein [Mesonia sp. K4-1]TXK77880.1 hypothetical protein FT986_04045 [Mesonia sp. K4-1]
MLIRIFNTLKQNLAIFLISIWLLIPYFAYNNYARLLAFLAFSFFLFKNEKRINKKLLFGILLYIIYTFTINALFSANSYMLRHLQLYILFGCILIAYIITKQEDAIKNKIKYIILSLNLIALLSSLYVLKDNMGAARLLAKSTDEAVELSNKGLGGYGLIYANVLMLPLFFYYRKRTNNLYKQVLIYANILFSITFILLADYLIAIILIIFQLLTFLFIKASYADRIIIIGILLVTLLLFYNNLNYFDKLTYSWVEFSSLRYKQEDIFNMFRGVDGNNNTIDGRTGRYFRSLNLLASNPITGTFSFDEIGKHSNIIDQFAQYGIIFGFLMLRIIFMLPQNLLRTTNNEYLKYFLNIYMVTLILLGILNNYGAAMGCSFLLLSCVENKSMKSLKFE